MLFRYLILKAYITNNKGYKLKKGVSSSCGDKQTSKNVVKLAMANNEYLPCQLHQIFTEETGAEELKK